MTGASRPSVRVGKRALAAFAAGSIAVPLSFGLMGGTAFAAAQGSSTPPAPTAIDGVCPSGQVPDSNFPDTQNDFFKDAINCLVAYGVTQGYPDGNYKPSLAVNREQMALFFFRVGKAAGMSWNTSDAGFKDINTASSQEAKDAINALANAKIIQGFTDGTYRPAVVVHRDAMAKFIANTVKALGGPDLTTSTNDYYTDDAGDIFENFINGITDGKISNGIGGHLYGPGLPVQRDAMAGFISRSMEVLYEAGKLPSQFNANVSSVTVSPTSQQAGQPVTITVTPASGAPAISTVKVTGACAPDTTATSDANSNTAGFQVNVPTTTTATAGTCNLTVVTTFADGTTATNTVPLTITAAPQTATQLPQLVSAKIISTKNAGQVVNPAAAGTTVEYDFSHSVISAQAGDYKIYTASDVPTTGNSIVSVSGNAVQVLFQAVTATDNTSGAAANVNNYSLATVVPGAVTDSQGQTNPDGSAAIGSSQSSTTTGSPNKTTGPDLVSVTNFRQGAASGGAAQTAVDFVFDQAATAVNTAGYHLVQPNGTVIDCVGPAAGSATASGGTIPGGNGTTTITVECPDTNAGTANALSSGNLARAYVDAGTVKGTDTAAKANPLEAFHFGQNTTLPDLVSAQVIAAGTGSNSSTTNDQVLYTFDQSVATATAGSFSVIQPDTTTNVGQTATVGGTGSNQVLVTYSGKVAQTAVGTIAAASATNPANRTDELGLTPTSQTSTITPGVVAAPQLQSVKMTTTTDAFGNKSYSLTYTFSQPIGATPTITAGAFHAYDANGQELTATNCTAPVGATTSNNQVVCGPVSAVNNGFAQGNTTGGTAATTAMITGVTLGTVDAGAVTGSTAPTNNPNPEGAANITQG